MKTIQKIVLITLLTAFQFCKSQDAKRYSDDYNKIAPRLQSLANEKKQFYDKSFSEFLRETEKKNIKIIDYGIKGKTDTSENIYILILWYLDHDLSIISAKNNYQKPFVLIHFKDQLPDEIKTLTRKYQGQLSSEVQEFLSNRKIEKIEFYGINGLTSKDRTVR